MSSPMLRALPGSSKVMPPALADCLESGCSLTGSITANACLSSERSSCES
jgi:hypothetical protein